MFFIDVLWSLFPLYFFRSERDSLSETESILQVVPVTMAASSSTILCNAAESDLCRDDSAAFLLKLVAIASILLAGAAGVAIPLIGRNRRFLQTDSNLFVTAKAFAAGVILATGFVHMLAGGTEALNNPCLPEYPWSKFPFPGFFAMVAALITLLVDFMGTQYYERKQEREANFSAIKPSPFLLSSNSNLVICDSNSEKPKGVEADSFPRPIKPNGTPYVSAGLSIGDPHSKKSKGRASVTSSSLTKPSCNTGVSSGVSIGVPNSKKPNENEERIRRGRMIRDTYKRSECRGSWS